MRLLAETSGDKRQMRPRTDSDVSGADSHARQQPHGTQVFNQFVKIVIWYLANCGRTLFAELCHTTVFSKFCSSQQIPENCYSVNQLNRVARDKTLPHPRELRKCTPPLLGDPGHQNIPSPWMPGPSSIVGAYR